MNAGVLANLYTPLWSLSTSLSLSLSLTCEVLLDAGHLSDMCVELHEGGILQGQAQQQQQQQES
jgi:hypothetical protein